MPVQLEWSKCTRDNWHDLLDINLDLNHFDGIRGVYVIWYDGKKPTVLKVGQGLIHERINEHRKDYVLAAYCQYGLYVTWAEVEKNDCDGVERYIGESLRPLVGCRLPNVLPIKVNLPWEERSLSVNE